MLTIDATNLPRLIQCNGSRLLDASYPPTVEDNTARDEGTAAHYMAMAAFSQQHTIEELIDRKAPNGVYMTPEMADHISDYLASIKGRGEMECETGYGDNVNYRVNGRADHIWYNHDTLSHDMDGLIISEPGSLHVDDFKYGWRIVEPEKNWTLISHAIGYCISRQIVPKQIILTIHQPRPHHRDGKVRSWTIDWEKLLELYAKITTTLSNPNDLLQTGLACNKCRSLATCPAARLAELNSIETSELAFNDQIDNDVLSFTLDQLSRAQSMIDARLKACEELALHRIQKGEVIKNYSHENSLTNRQWKDGVNGEFLKIMTGVDPYEPAKLKTPAKIEKLGVSKDTVNMFAERKPTGTKLVRIDADKKAKKLLGEKQ